VAELVIEREIRIEAPPEVVFPYFTDADKMTQWKGRDAKLEATPGGVYRVEINERDTAVGEYVEIDPPRRVVFTWGWAGNDGVPPGSSTVEITLTPDGDATVVRLTHRGLPDQNAIDQHSHGWEHYGERLAIAAAGGNPGPDPWAEPPTDEGH
jgi:uncharacterized protein YndB with AHSA1/START domain